MLGAGGPVHLPRDPTVLEDYGNFLQMPPEADEELEQYAARLEEALRENAFKLLLETDRGISFANLHQTESLSASNGGTVQASWNTYQLPISAIYDGEDTSVDFARMYMDRETLRRLAQIPDAYHSIRVKLKDPRHAKEVKEDFLKKFPDFYTATWEEHRADFLRAVNNEKVLLAIVLSFIVLLGGFIILATLTLTVVEKTKDIGVLSALGATRRGVMELFIGNGFFIGVLGSILGVLLGWLFVSNVDWVHRQLREVFGIEMFPSDIYLFREIPTVWSWGTVAWIVGGSLLMAFVAGFFPALRAARMDPVKALRYE
jgi:lipoprotein-releasing system permease protein